ncbi:hypothetical protein [Halomontanus rarus]|nr:hypothetical protein [Halovivax sp. TS33]
MSVDERSRLVVEPDRRRPIENGHACTRTTFATTIDWLSSVPGE